MKKLTNLFMIILCLVLSIVLFCSIFMPTNVFYEPSKAISLLLMLFILAVWFFFYQKIAVKIVKWDDKKKKFLFALYFLLFFLVQYFLFQELKVNPTWDFGVIYHNAQNYVNHSPIGYLEYFEYCPNNIVIYLFYILIMKASLLFSIQNPLNILGVCNILLIELSVYLTFKVAKKIYEEKIAITLLFIVLFLSPLFLYSPIIYTDTTTLFVPVLLIYLFLKTQETKGKKQYSYIFFFSVIAFLGYKLKMSCFIIAIAIFLHMILNKRWQNLGKFVCILGITFLSFSFLFHSFILNNSKFHFQDNGVGPLPFTHYLMMGLEDNSKPNLERMTYGGYVEEDVIFTKSFTIVARKTANIEEIKRRLSTYTPFEFIKYLGHKIANTWGDGTYFAPIKLSKSPIKESFLQEFVLPNGTHFALYLNFAEGVQFAILLLLVISVWKEKRDNTKTYLYTSIFGLFLFLLFWETRSRYIVNYIPIFLLVLAGALQVKKKN